MNNILKEARKLRTIIEQAATSLTDEVAIEAAPLFPKLKNNNSLVAAGTRINWNGTVKRAAVDLWDTEENNPDNAPILWEDINMKDEYREIPETISAGLAFALGERGWWKETLYESLLDNNVWTPDQYPAGWKIVE